MFQARTIWSRQDVRYAAGIEKPYAVNGADNGDNPRAGFVMVAFFQTLSSDHQLQVIEGGEYVRYHDGAGGQRVNCLISARVDIDYHDEELDDRRGRDDGSGRGFKLVGLGKAFRERALLCRAICAVHTQDRVGEHRAAQGNDYAQIDESRAPWTYNCFQHASQRWIS